jgi:oligoendopeptidase F
LVATAEPTNPADVLTRDRVPIGETWDLSTIYPDDDAWEAEAARIPHLIETAAAHRGSLDASPMALLTALGDVMALRLAIERLRVYAALRRDEDTTDQAARARYERSIALAVEAGEALAFVQPEILAMPEGKLAVFAVDPVLSSYRHLLADLQRHRGHVRSVEVEEILAQVADVARAPAEAFGALDNADLAYGTVRDEEGREVTLTKGRYGLLIESRNRAVRREASERLMAAYRAHRHTLASLYGASVRNDVFSARVRGFASARQAALFDDNLPEAVYASLIAAVRAARPTLQRYLELRRRTLGLDRLAGYDLRAPLAPEPQRLYEWDEALELVLDGLAPLGDDYVADLAGGFAARWVDVRETKGKRSGAYSWGAYGAPPVILMNWNGTLHDVFTLAHEAGHAMHSLLSDRAQPYHNAGYPLVLAEIASTVNEVLLAWHMLGRLDGGDAVGRFAILNRMADDLIGTVVNQTLYAEFEHRAHALAEEGQPLTLETLSDVWTELSAVYQPEVEFDDLDRLRWARVPHFYRAFYVFKYATGMSAAYAVARAVRDEGAPAVDRYLTFLAAGGSDYPLDLLRRAGVDLATPEPVEAALAELEAIVAEMARLAEAGVLAA